MYHNVLKQLYTSTLSRALHQATPIILSTIHIHLNKHTMYSLQAIAL